MASIRLVKKSAALRTAPGPAKAGDPIPSYVLQDNQDGSFTVNGCDATGAAVDISAVATLTPAPVSSDATILSVDAPVGMTVACHGQKPGHADVTVTATFNDGSVGPFTITVPADVGTGPVTALVVSFGAPTIRG